MIWLNKTRHSAGRMFGRKTARKRPKRDRIRATEFELVQGPRLGKHGVHGVHDQIDTLARYIAIQLLNCQHPGGAQCVVNPPRGCSTEYRVPGCTRRLQLYSTSTAVQRCTSTYPDSGYSSMRVCHSCTIDRKAAYVHRLVRSCTPSYGSGTAVAAGCALIF
jgi:hypothetical protein